MVYVSKRRLHLYKLYMRVLLLVSFALANVETKNIICWRIRMIQSGTAVDADLETLDIF